MTQAGGRPGHLFLTNSFELRCRPSGARWPSDVKSVGHRGQERGGQKRRRAPGAQGRALVGPFACAQLVPAARPEGLCAPLQLRSRHVLGGTWCLLCTHARHLFCWPQNSCVPRGLSSAPSKAVGSVQPRPSQPVRFILAATLVQRRARRPACARQTHVRGAVRSWGKRRLSLLSCWQCGPRNACLRAKPTPAEPRAG